METFNCFKQLIYFSLISSLCFCKLTICSFKLSICDNLQVYSWYNLLYLLSAKLPPISFSDNILSYLAIFSYNSLFFSSYFFLFLLSDNIYFYSFSNDLYSSKRSVYLSESCFNNLISLFRLLFSDSNFFIMFSYLFLAILLFCLEFS